jgi:DNA primase RepB-like protein
MGKHQVIWRVKGFTIPEQEVMLKGLAETFGGDRACTDCARVFRLPGFFNRKYSPAFPVTLEMRAIQLEYSRSDFMMELPTNADVQPHHFDRPRSLGSGALTTREQQNNARRLHASGELEQASRTEQGCKDDGLE